MNLPYLRQIGIDPVGKRFLLYSFLLAQYNKQIQFQSFYDIIIEYTMHTKDEATSRRVCPISFLKSKMYLFLITLAPGQDPSKSNYSLIRIHYVFYSLVRSQSFILISTMRVEHHNFVALHVAAGRIRSLFICCFSFV